MNNDIEKGVNHMCASRLEEFEHDPNVMIVGVGDNGMVAISRRPDIEDHMTPITNQLFIDAMQKRNDLDKVVADMYLPELLSPVPWTSPTTRIDKISYIIALTIIDENKLLALSDVLLDKVLTKVRALQLASEENK